MTSGANLMRFGRSTRSQTNRRRYFGLTNLPNCAIINKSPVERTLKRDDKNRIAARYSVYAGGAREDVKAKKRVSRDIRENEKLLKKTFQKPLDKLEKMWYNK